MAQYPAQILSQSMRMEQRLTPQMLQSMAVLQKPIAELEAFIAQALESNAALEVDETRPGEPHGAASRAPTPEDHKNSDAAGFRRLSQFPFEQDSEWSWSGRHGPRRGDTDMDPKMGAMANTAGPGKDLYEHLLEQWGLLELSSEVRRAGMAIIQALDADGYLRKPLADVMAELRPRVPLEIAQEALREVQHLEPAGVGATSLLECLLLQLDAMPGDNTIERTLVEHHLEDIAQNRLPAVSKATGFTMGEITEAMKVIRSELHLHPGSLVGERAVPPIRPDVIVEYADSGGGLTVRLVRGNVPKLRVRDEVVALAKSKDAPKDEREFAKKHVEEAGMLIDAVHFRNSRLLQVARCVAEKQRDFFDQGPTGLRILRMTDVAEELGCDASTISRTVADKYLQTPHGIFPMRYFFTGGMETLEGEVIGWETIKGRVRDVVQAEDPKEPLNDDQIAEILAKDGIELSRRTVGKYRQQMGIPAARQRKVFE
jgi:RNA polymerase sigma-54 factor